MVLKLNLPALSSLTPLPSPNEAADIAVVESINNNLLPAGLNAVDAADAADAGNDAEDGIAINVAMEGSSDNEKMEEDGYVDSSPPDPLVNEEKDFLIEVVGNPDTTIVEAEQPSPEALPEEVEGSSMLGKDTTTMTINNNNMPPKKIPKFPSFSIPSESQMNSVMNVAEESTSNNNNNQTPETLNLLDEKELEELFPLAVVAPPPDEMVNDSLEMDEASSPPPPSLGDLMLISPIVGEAKAMEEASESASESEIASAVQGESVQGDSVERDEIILGEGVVVLTPEREEAEQAEEEEVGGETLDGASDAEGGEDIIEDGEEDAKGDGSDINAVETVKEASDSDGGEDIIEDGEEDAKGDGIDPNAVETVKEEIQETVEEPNIDITAINKVEESSIVGTEEMSSNTTQEEETSSPEVLASVVLMAEEGEGEEGESEEDATLEGGEDTVTTVIEEKNEEGVDEDEEDEGETVPEEDAIGEGDNGTVEEGSGEEEDSQGGSNEPESGNVDNEEEEDYPEEEGTTEDNLEEDNSSTVDEAEVVEEEDVAQDPEEEETIQDLEGEDSTVVDEAEEEEEDAAEDGNQYPSTTEGQGAELNDENSKGNWEGFDEDFTSPKIEGEKDKGTKYDVESHDPSESNGATGYEGDGFRFHILHPKKGRGSSSTGFASSQITLALAFLAAFSLCFCCYKYRRGKQRYGKKTINRGTYAAVGSDDFFNGTFSDDISFRGKDSDDELSDDDDYDDGTMVKLEMGGIHELDANGGLTLDECNG